MDAAGIANRALVLINEDVRYLGVSSDSRHARAKCNFEVSSTPYLQ